MKQSIFFYYFQSGVENSAEAKKPQPSKSAKQGKVVLDEYGSTNYYPKLSENDKALALNQLNTAKDNLPLDQATQLYMDTRILLRHFLFEEPKPDLTEVLANFGKWLKYVSLYFLLCSMVMRVVQF